MEFLFTGVRPWKRGWSNYIIFPRPFICSSCSWYFPSCPSCPSWINILSRLAVLYFAKREREGRGLRVLQVSLRVLCALLVLFVESHTGGPYSPPAAFSSIPKYGARSSVFGVAG